MYKTSGGASSSNRLLLNHKATFYSQIMKNISKFQLKELKKTFLVKIQPKIKRSDDGVRNMITLNVLVDFKIHFDTLSSLKGGSFNHLWL